ncbi:MAG: triose-phosphate isomerase [Patescibacteria group bacterium]|nr:triose-phosphate isomerase [Patescibacteria group bacterium]
MKKLIVANWKCNPTSQKEARQLFDSLKKRLKNLKKTEVVICPPFVYLLGFRFPRSTPAFSEKGQGLRGRQVSSFRLGAQNCFWEEKGAFTGEISPAMLKNLGVKYTILGHSERRKLFRESNEMVNAKVLKALSFGLFPIICLGEDEEERKKGKTFRILEKEIKTALKKVPKSKIRKVVVAYEPIWAIGTGNSCLPDEALTATLFLRKIISKIFSKKTAENIPILYGGSVTSENAQDYLREQGIDGLLVGGASLRTEEFTKIVKSANIN